MIRRWLQKLGSQSRGERDLRKVFESTSEVDEAIHFEEVGLPKGTVTTIQWLRSVNEVRSRVSHRLSPTESHAWCENERQRVEFESLIDSIRMLDRTPIEDYSASVRDGGYYFIAWGTRDSVRSVTFRIPLQGDERQRLVTLIESSVREQRNANAATMDVAKGER